MFNNIEQSTEGNIKERDVAYKDILEKDKVYVNLFSDEQKRNANKRVFQECWQKEKVVHRLLTCSFDIENREGTYRIYFSGLNKENLLCYFELDDCTKKSIFIEIESLNNGNIEGTDFYNRLIKYISYDYIVCILANQYNDEHNMLTECMENVISLSDYVKKYTDLAKDKRLDFKYKEYDILNQLANNNTQYEKVVEIIVDRLGRFFEYDRKQYLFGSQLNGEYVKFSFPAEKQSEYTLIGDRKFYEYKANTIAEDYFDGCGFSFGEIRKTFFYFQYGSYGEQLMFVTPLDDEIYYKREFEYLGRKLIIGNICSMKNIDILEYILDAMSTEEKESFFCNRKSSSFEKTFGTVEETIELMRKYDEDGEDNGYAKAIHYLISKQKEYANLENISVRDRY